MSSTVHRLRLTFSFLALMCFMFSVNTSITYCPMEAENLETTDSESCTCVTGNNTCSCACRSLFSVENLNAESGSFPKCKEFELLLEHSALPFLPHRLFSMIYQPTRLHIKLDNSTVYLLGLNSEAYSPFKNLGFDEIYICVQRSSTLAGWKWKAFQQLLPTKGGSLSFSIVKTELLYLPDEFSSAAKGEIYAVRILQCKLRWLGKRVFEPLHKLRVLELRNNLLQDITRSQLPKLPSELKVLDLGKNRLSHIPHDLLEGLPLKTFFIDGNHITCLEPNIVIRVRDLGISDLGISDFQKMPVCNSNTTDPTTLEHQSDQQ